MDDYYAFQTEQFLSWLNEIKEVMEFWYGVVVALPVPDHILIMEFERGTNPLQMLRIAEERNTRNIGLN